MKITAIKTHKITDKDKNIFNILDKYIKTLPEKSVLAVTSKIVAICEGRFVAKTGDETQKDELAKKEADYFLPRTFSQYGFMITIKNNVMVASAGIDESNGFGHFILWPKDPVKSANQIREYLLKKHKLRNLGVIITDSKLTPLRWGVTGVAIAYSGFKPLYSYIGRPDIFGRKLRAEKSNVADALATAAVLVMGEGEEQQPLALIEDINFVRFQKRNPTPKEIAALRISLEDDVYSRLLTSVDWQKGV